MEVFVVLLLDRRKSELYSSPVVYRVKPGKNKHDLVFLLPFIVRFVFDNDFRLQFWRYNKM